MAPFIKTPLDVISFPSSAYTDRNRFVINLFDEIEKSHKNIIPIRVEQLFCNSFIKDQCVAQYDSVPYYYDDDHLSDEGVKLLLNLIEPYLIDSGNTFKDKATKNTKRNLGAN